MNKIKGSPMNGEWLPLVVGLPFFTTMKKKKDTYVDLLKDPRWQKKRLEIMQRDNFTCQHCGCQDKELQIHHLIYHKDYKPWEYDSEELITLCNRCHEVETEYNNILYSNFCYLKTIAGRMGLSKQLLDAIFCRISSFIGCEEEEYDLVSDSIKKLIYDAACGVQLYSDAKVLEKIGFDMSDYFKNVKTKNLCEK